MAQAAASAASEQADTASFVAYVIAGQIAEALLAAADVFGLALVLADNLGDILEARQAVVTLHFEVVGHGVRHLRGHDGLHDILVAVQLAALGPASQLVAQQQHEGLITVQQHVFALLVAQRNADAVRIGVRGQHQIGALLGRKVDGHRHGLALFGIRRLDGGGSCRR